MAVRGVEIIKFLMRQGVMLKINDVIDNDTAELVADRIRPHRPPRVGSRRRRRLHRRRGRSTITWSPGPRSWPSWVTSTTARPSLLDALRTADVAGGEHGGITQHIGAYQVRLDNGQSASPSSTPRATPPSRPCGRAAPTSPTSWSWWWPADDGVMPQTIEAIQHARAAGAPIIVAINKIDKPGADPTAGDQRAAAARDRGRKPGRRHPGRPGLGQTEQHGPGRPDRGASCCRPRCMDLKANPDRTADGVVIEAKLDKGRGAGRDRPGQARHAEARRHRRGRLGRSAGFAPC